MPDSVTDQPAIFIGFARALVLFLMVWGVHITQSQADATLNLLVFAIPVVSLAFTFWSSRVTVPKTPSSSDPKIIQTPPPAGSGV